jgi:transcriptional regulator with XRE-family HTH domain
MYASSEEKELYDYLSNPEIRHLYVESNIRQLLPMQLKSMREARGWSQPEVGEKAGMKQSAIARLEDPRYGSMTLSTLKRLAKAFDVALIVRFAPFSDFISWTAQINEPRLSPPSFNEEKPPVMPSPPATTSPIPDTKDKDAYPPKLIDILISTSPLIYSAFSKAFEKEVVNAGRTTASSC